MNLSKYEKVTRIAAISIMLLGAAMWAYYFLRYVMELLIYYGIEYTFEEFLRAWYAQILQMSADVIGVILLLVFRKKGLPVILGVCSLIIALECALDAYLLLVEYKQIFDADPADFFQGAISLVIAAMLFFNAILYSIGATKSAALIKFATIALILLQIFGVIVELRERTSLSMIAFEREYSISSYLLLILILHMSMSKYTRQISNTGSIKTSIRDLRNSMMTEGVGIDRNIAVRFSDYNKNGLWCDSYSFVLTAHLMGKYCMTLSPVDGKMVGRISAVENDSGMNVFRFNVTGVWFDSGDVNTCDVMRFYGTEGLFIQFIVRDDYDYKPMGIPKMGAAKLSSREEGTTTHKIRLKVSAFMGFVKKYLTMIKDFLRKNTVDRIKNRKKKKE